MKKITALLLLFLLQSSCLNKGEKLVIFQPKFSHVIDFYSGIRSDNASRMIVDLWHLDDSELDLDDAAFYWLFPTVKSEGDIQNLSPRLGQKDVEIFIKKPALNVNLNNSLARVARFYGFKMVNNRDGVNFERGLNFDARKKFYCSDEAKHRFRLRRVV